ncbi:hypothetical protein RxyAA322_15420 [Rubrobacter xylanophilus]|uniref:Uncharacterized protein n=1 Tax=Rubrobacter xylanophilus TaxID=49319 RepID=A0A510HIE5_9ACTN|nr:hypothetical protein [Rubrobacter xylanophilus]BBL79688.1 hypothetical protein RxyAA322_15420 [Rubrobacter xylanophilus]
MRIPGRYGRNLQVVVRSSGAPYGYTVTIWTSGALLIHAQHLPSLAETLLFMAGSVLGYGAVGVVAFGGLQVVSTPERGRLALWGNMHFLSIGAAMLGAYLVSHAIGGELSWFVTGLVATATYLLVSGVESAVAEEPERE